MFVSLKVVVVCLYSLVLSCIGYMSIVSSKADCLTIYIYIRTDRGSSEWSFPWWARDLEFQGFSGFSRTLGKYLLNVEALKNLHEFWVPKSAKNKKQKSQTTCCGMLRIHFLPTVFSEKSSHPPDSMDETSMENIAEIDPKWYCDGIFEILQKKSQVF